MDTMIAAQAASVHDVEEMTDYELERGKPMPSKVHAATQTNVIDALLRYKKKYRRLTEISLRLGKEKLVPDIALYSIDASDWHENEAEMSLPPLLCVEIVSPSQSIDEMKEKADKYFAAGVRSVWLVLPALAGVMLLHATSKPQFFSEGDLVDSELGITIPVEEVFE
ncbi:MAG: Uma2 family endonuclease [Candidatus Kapabacteria bacterium]|jgi:Uma2 family endonuclease|nr:Uma2 family endonuclease [Candidatus Kapabacteria bacterium]